MAKNKARDNERRAVVEQMRKEQARKERARSLAILGVCVVIVIALLGSAIFVYVKDQRAKDKAAAAPMSDIGVSLKTAGCSAVQEKKATGNNVHVTVGQKIPYTDAPPSFGRHWGNFLQGSEIRNLYTTKDRPPLERMVHSLEHGHTILWYDDTVKPGSKGYQAIQAMADKLDASAYFMAAPWMSADGGSFPSGKHVALTHWTGPDDQQGVTQYCTDVSGGAVASFMKKYPASDAPEPGAA